MTSITPELRQAIEAAGEEPVRLEDRETKTSYVLLKEDVYRKLREAMDEEQDERERRTLLDRSRKNRLAWLKENPY